MLSWLWELSRLSGQNALVRGVIGGWDLNGILTLLSGAPFSLPSGVDNSFSGLNADRVDQVLADASVPNPNPKAWFNTKAFAPNAAGTLGDTSRNLLIGPGLTDVDMSLVKNFIVRERWNLQFRGEAFGLTNHPSYNQPVGNLSSATYGQITGSAGAAITCARTAPRRIGRWRNSRNYIGAPGTGASPKTRLIRGRSAH